MTHTNTLLILAVVVAIAVAVYNNNSVQHLENPVDKKQKGVSPPQDSGVVPANALGSNEQPAQVGGESDQTYALPDNRVPKDCFPKDQLSPDELLPGNAATRFAASNPQAGGELKDQNFLEAGYHVGVNTVGQSLRNANRQLRSEPPNPQVKVSPWQTTTIEPDINRRPLEIGGCA
jgi:hypothetical protein